jgi:hypothetical protein
MTIGDNAEQAGFTCIQSADSIPFRDAQDGPLDDLRDQNEPAGEAMEHDRS